jgi:tetratricopeptide (TPR) repeat protein
MPESISAIAKVLLPVVKALWPKLRRVYRERQAGRMPVGRADDLLEKGMEGTLKRLIGGKIDDAWWRNILDNIGHQYIAPDFLRIHAIHEWLSDLQVQTYFKSLAREHIMGADDYDQDALASLRQTYGDRTGENERFADGPIEIIVAIIAAGYFGIISPQIEPIAGMIQDHARESRKGFQKLDEGLGSVSSKLENLGPDHYVVETHNKVAQFELEQLLKQRSFEPDRIRNELINLLQRVVKGDLIHADNSIKAEILYWSARLHASKNETLSLAREYLEQLLHLIPGTDTRIIDALVLETEGDVDGTLRILRDIDDADGHSTFFIVCNRQHGEESALSWFDEQLERDNPEFLTGIGWANLTITLAKKDRWSEAAERLATAHDYSEQWPDLAFVEGVVNAAMLLPEELRPYALEMNLFHSTIRTIEGAEADQHRARSKVCFEKAHKLFIGIDQKGRAQAAKDWHLWLRLTDPNPAISQDAKQEVVEGMKEVPRAVDLMPFARTFGIGFDEGPVKRYLAQRRRTGGLDNRELLAELFLAELKMSSRELADFIHNQEERLSKVVLKATLSGLLIGALVKDGQTRRAREILEERKDDFVDHDYQRLHAMIDAKDGADPRAQLENLYAQTGSLIDLKNLVSHLKLAGDWKALQPRLEELFQREKTADNALMLTHCFRSNAQSDHFSILTFLEENHDILDHSDDLLSEKAWMLSHAGRLKEAEKINSELLKKRDNENDLELDINIALQLGDWDRFSVIINHAMRKREELGPHMLIRLASLAAEVDADTDRAFELSKMAADKGADDPQLLMEDYVLAVQLGREDQISAEWFARAIDLSSDDGPLMKVDIRTLAEEMMPAHRERVREVEQALIKGEISLQAAANNFGQSASRILVEIPRINTDLQDGRRRTVVPIRSGSRRNVEMKSEWKVCLDGTSIMVLNHLNMLEKTVNAFQQIVLNPDTMIFLLNERRRARFHQPSRIQRAEEFRSLLDQGLLKIAPSIPDSPKDLIDEVGRDFADMLEAARAGGGRVIRPFPIFKSGSFMEREAELGDYADYLIATKAFVKVLYEKKGMIDSETFNRAYQYLTVQDRGGNSDEDQSLIDCQLYLDELSITYLQHVDLLNVVCNSGL